MLVSASAGSGAALTNLDPTKLNGFATEHSDHFLRKDGTFQPLPSSIGTAESLATDNNAGKLTYNDNDDIWTLTAAGTNTVFFEQSQISSNVGITVNGVVSANAFAGNGAALTDITAVTANLLSTDSEAGQLSYNANDDIWTLTAGDTNTVFFEQSQISSNVGITVNGVVSANAFAGSGAALTNLDPTKLNGFATEHSDHFLRKDGTFQPLPSSIGTAESLATDNNAGKTYLQ